MTNAPRSYGIIRNYTTHLRGQ